MRLGVQHFHCSQKPVLPTHVQEAGAKPGRTCIQFACPVVVMSGLPSGIVPVFGQSILNSSGFYNTKNPQIPSDFGFRSSANYQGSCARAQKPVHSILPRLTWNGLSPVLSQWINGSRRISLTRHGGWLGRSPETSGNFTGYTRVQLSCGTFFLSYPYIHDGFLVAFSLFPPLFLRMCTTAYDRTRSSHE